MTLPLFHYQDYAADIMAGRDRYGLHDEMGIGKTATCIGTINRTFGQRGIIVCPAMLRENWIKEFKKFSTYDLRLCKGQNIHDFVAWSRNRFDVLITSYELATKWRKEFAKVGEYLDFMVFDEAHYLKNVEANRTREMFGVEADGIDCLVEWAVSAYHVTGTPMAKDPMDIYTFLRFVKAFKLSFREFINTFFEYSEGMYGIKTQNIKPEMLSVLQALINNNSIRRTHQDVGMELPPIFMSEVLIDGDKREILEFIREFPNLEAAIIFAVESGNLSSIDADHIATLRRLIGKAKAIPYAQMLKLEMDAGARKRIVYGLHIHALEHIQAYMKKSGYDFVLVNGNTPERERQDAVRRFQEDPKCDGFIGNIKTAGVGLTLVQGCDIDMFESDWSPAGNAQAIKRVHRYGQQQAVRGRFITLADSIDVAVNRIVAENTAAIAQIEGFSMNSAPPIDSASLLR